MKVLIFTAILLLPTLFYGQGSPDKIDMSWYFQPENELLIDYMHTTSGTVEVRYKSKEPATFSVYFITWKSKNSSEYTRNELLTTYCTEKDCIFTLDKGKLDPNGFNTLVFRDKSGQHDYVLPLEANPNVTSPILLSNELGDWVSDRSIEVNTPLTLQTLDEKAVAYVFYYATSFDPADPPGGLRGRAAPQLRPDSVFTVLALTTFVPKKPGLYLLQTDTLSRNGYAFRVHEGSYPDYKTIKELTPPLVYLTTAEEWKKLRYPATERADFEKVWLEMAGTEVQAGAGIKYFYRGINKANTLFSGYKEGWKTDKGLIYTVFGPPSAVYTDGFTQHWDYYATENHGQIRFSFVSSAGIFSQYHSILQRKRNYDLIWYRTVDRLRRGSPNYE